MRSMVAVVMRRRGFESGTVRSMVRCSCCLTIRHTKARPCGHRRVPCAAWSRWSAAACRLAMAERPRFAWCPGFDSLTFRLVRPWPIGRGASLPSWRGGFDSHRALWSVIGDRLVVGHLALNQATEVRPLLPELAAGEPCLAGQTDAGSSNGRMRRSERRYVGSSPAPAV